MSIILHEDQTKFELARVQLEAAAQHYALTLAALPDVLRRAYLDGGSTGSVAAERSRSLDALVPPVERELSCVRRTEPLLTEWRVTTGGREIHLHLKATLPVPAGCRAQPPRGGHTPLPQGWMDFPKQAQELLIEYLRPVFGEQP